MTNTVLFHKMINEYTKVAYAHQYIWGFEYDGNIYMTFTNADMIPYVCKLDMASRGAGYALRFSPKNAQKVLLLQGARVLCSKEYFKEAVEASQYNNGEIFEKLVTEYFGQTWTKDNVPFTEGADLVVNGTNYQIKYQKATFCNEKSLARLTNR